MCPFVRANGHTVRTGQAAAFFHSHGAGGGLRPVSSTAIRNPRTDLRKTRVSVWATLAVMTSLRSLTHEKGARAHEAICRSRVVRLGFALGVAAALVGVVGCNDDESNTVPENQNAGLSPGSGGSSQGGSGGQGGTSSSTGGSSTSVPSGGTEGSLPNDIPLGSGGSSDGSTEASIDAGVQPDAGSPPVIQPPTGFAPCPTDGTPCKIMPLGDSITDGIDSTQGYASNAGYRLELFRQAITAGHDITFVGTRPPNGPTGDVAGQPFPRNHEGISGNTIAQVAARVDAALVANPPDIVLLQIGTNNLYQGMAADVPGQLASLLDQITAGAPDALLVVAQITPLGGMFPNNGVGPYNAAIPGLVQERVSAGKHIIVVDQFTQIASTPNFVTALLPDNIHPNAAGYAIMGGTWYGAIETFLP
jgi:lysophospholipase L1-like esterase